MRSTSPSVELHPGDGRTDAGVSAATQILGENLGVNLDMPFGVDNVRLGKMIDDELDIQSVQQDGRG